MTAFVPPYLTDDYCTENGVLIVTAGYYRFSLCLSLATSATSATYLVYFFHKRYKNLSLHSNIKVLLCSLYLCCFSYACLNIVMKVHYILLPFLISTPCEIFLSKAIYLCTQLPIVFILFFSQYIQIAMIVERCVATVFVRDYESGYKNLGLVLLAAAVTATFVILLVLYHGVQFNGLYLNGRMLPQDTYAVANLIIIVMLCINLAGLACTVLLHFVNRRRQIRTTLSSKFQSIENRVTSNLLFWASSIQFTTFVLTDIATLFVRLFQHNNRLAMAYKENADLFNFYTLFLPVLTTIYLAKVRQRRIRDIRNTVNIKAVGNEGWKNYSAVIEHLWK